MPRNKQYGHRKTSRAKGGQAKAWAILASLAAWALALCAWGASRIAALSGYHSDLGRPLFEAFDRAWYWPWKFLTWAGEYSHFPQVKQIVDQTYMAGVGVPMLAVLIYLACQQSLKGRDDLHGSAHWATPEEVEKTGLMAGQGVYVGGWLNPKTKKLHYLRHNGPEHILCFAPTRSGKGVGLILPTLLGWAHSTIVLDIKGENWSLSSGHLHALGHKTLRFEPTDESGTAARYNPFAEIRLDTSRAISDVQRLSAIILDPLGKGLEDYWGKAANGFFGGAILHCVIMTRKNKGRTANLNDLSVMLEDPDRPVKEVFEEMLKTDHAALMGEMFPHLLNKVEVKDDKGQVVETRATNAFGDAAHVFIASAAQGMIQKADNERSGVVNTATANLSLYRDPVIADNVADSDFSINDLMNGDKPANLYLVISPDKIDDLVPLVRIILTQIVGRLIAKMDFADGTSQAAYKHRLLLMLDEFPALGKLPVLVKAQPYMAGYGVKEYFITQDLKQLNEAYGKDNSIVGNCHIKMAYAPNDTETAKYLSETLGNTTVVEKKVSTSSGRGGTSRSTSVSETARPLLTPDECTRLPGLQKDPATGQATAGGNMVIIPSGHPPIYGDQILYFQDPFFSAKSKIPPPTASPVAKEFADPNKKAAEEPAPEHNDAYSEYLKAAEGAE